MTIYRRTRSARWQRVLPGVYVLTTGHLSDEQRRIAGALYAGENAQITSLAALAWHGFRYAPSSDRVQLLVPHEARRRSAGHVVIARAMELDPNARDAGLYRVCSPARAVVDAGRELRELRPIRAIAAEAVQRGFTDPPALVDEIRRAKRSRTALIMCVVDEILAGVRSAPEAELRECLAGSALEPLLRWNPSLHESDGIRSRRPMRGSRIQPSRSRSTRTSSITRRTGGAARWTGTTNWAALACSCSTSPRPRFARTPDAYAASSRRRTTHGSAPSPATC